MSTKPTRHGARWTKQEEDEILASIKAGLSLRIIATRKERSTSGIRARLTQIACRFVEVDKMPLYEAAERTGIKVDHLRAVLSLKMEPAPHSTVTPTPKMEFKFTNTLTRTKLQGYAEERKKAAEAARLEAIRQAVVQRVDAVASAVLSSAANGETFYLYDTTPDSPWVHHQMHKDVTTNDILRGFQEKFPECTVTLAEEWVDVPNRRPGQPLTRVLKSGIKIDWS
jgi:hypothetical protein